jgi:hypothetical protein
MTREREREMLLFMLRDEELPYENVTNSYVSLDNSKFRYIGATDGMYKRPNSNASEQHNHKGVKTQNLHHYLNC